MKKFILLATIVTVTAGAVIVKTNMLSKISEIELDFK